MYKKRPIYWLFSSGKQRAFQCLVYLHRYNEGTLARMRTEYVIPLSGKMATRIDQLAGDIAAASSTSHRRKLEKEREMLVKQREELQSFDEQLRHYADQRIKLGLNDGVKVNYGKFGNLLAEVKAITGGSSDD
jgi:type II restriction/modification system DNA methylase subunit YeeA